MSQTQSTKVGDAGVRTALHDAANVLLTTSNQVQHAEALGHGRRQAAGHAEGKSGAGAESSLLCCIGSGRTERSSSGAKTRPLRQPHNAKEGTRFGAGPRRLSSHEGPVAGDAEIVRQVPLQWPGAILRLRPVDCSATPSYSMKWRSRADHGQKHETGDWIHSELDDRGPITEAAEPKVHLSSICSKGVWTRKGRRSRNLEPSLTGQIKRPMPVCRWGKPQRS